VRQERTDWHSVVVWGKRGEALAKILAKGSSLFVEGSLRTSSYEKGGEKRYKTEINATNVILTGGRSAGSAPPSGAPEGSSRSRGYGAGNSRPVAPVDAAPMRQAGEDDDIPFATSEPGRWGL
jgi:single-strand DNA-binding protein